MGEGLLDYDGDPIDSAGGGSMTTIQWTDRTWNPVRGCSRVSLESKMLDQPLRWRKPSRVFVSSMSDLFHESLSDEEIAAVFGVMSACPQHTFEVLTKRPHRMVKWFEWVSKLECDPSTECHWAALERDGDDNIIHSRSEGDRVWPLQNVWLFVSAEPLLDSIAGGAK